MLESILRLSMLWQSKKAADLMRDPRILVHSVVTWLGLRANDLGVNRVGRMVSVDAGHDSDAMARDRAVQQALFGGREYVRSSPLPLEEFSPVDPVRLSSTARILD